MKKDLNSAVSVTVRVKNEGEALCVKCLAICDGVSRDLTTLAPPCLCQAIEVDGSGQQFVFDVVFPPTSTQKMVFDNIGASIVDHIFDGYNGCLMSYGQTGSGKTFSMIGPNGGSVESLVDFKNNLSAENERDCGLLPRVLQSIFQKLDCRPSSEVSWKIEMSCVELYNEAFIDLIGADRSDLRIREDCTPGGKGIFVEGACIVRVFSAAESIEVLLQATQQKHVASTKMNATSSRSHTIVMIFLEVVDNVRGGSVTTSRLYFADLAGSERIEKTGAFGDRLREAQNINLSLTLLGNVIKKLTDGNSLHVPYRDSKLTRLLQDCLGGNSLTTLLCTVSGNPNNTSESLSTLQFAQRAKSIKNQPLQNTTRSSTEMTRELVFLRQEVATLTEKLKDFSCVRSVNEGVMTDSLPSLLNELYQLKEELQLLRQENEFLQQKVLFHTKREEQICIEVKALKENHLAEEEASRSDPQARHLSPQSTFFHRKLNDVDILVKPQEFSQPNKSTNETVRDQQVEVLRAELSAARKYSVMCDQLLRDVDFQKAERERLSTEFNSTIETMKLKYEVALVKIQSELDDYKAAQNSTKVLQHAADLAHLEMENTELHKENRANAMRLLEFTKKIDSLTKEVNTLKDDREKLSRALEDANIDVQLKKRLMDMTQVKNCERSYFRKKLLECFST